MDDSIAWAAGLFEGEGNISIQPSGRRKLNRQVQVRLSMNDEDVVRRFMAVVGRGTVTLRKKQWCWRVCNKADCLHVLEMLRPYMGARRAARFDEALPICRFAPPYMPQSAAALLA